MKILVIIFLLLIPMESSLQQIKHKEPTKRVELKLDALNFDIQNLIKEVNEAIL